MKMKKLFKRLFTTSSDVVEKSETQYGCCINGVLSYYPTKEMMIKHIDSYSKSNEIFSLSMFRLDIFNLFK